VIPPHEKRETPCSKKEWLLGDDPECYSFVANDCGMEPDEDGNWEETIHFALHDGENTTQFDWKLTDRDDCIVALRAIEAVRRGLDRIDRYVRMVHEAQCETSRGKTCMSIEQLHEQLERKLREEQPLPLKGPTF
jgi:hypothetical protein